MSIVVLNKVDKIKTTSGTLIDLENIQASGGSGSTISDFGITLDTSGPDNVWSMDATLPTTTAFVVEKEQKTDGSVEFIFPTN